MNYASMAAKEPPKEPEPEKKPVKKPENHFVFSAPTMTGVEENELESTQTDFSQEYTNNLDTDYDRYIVDEPQNSDYEEENDQWQDGWAWGDC